MRWLALLVFVLHSATSLNGQILRQFSESDTLGFDRELKLEMSEDFLNSFIIQYSITNDSAGVVASVYDPQKTIDEWEKAAAYSKDNKKEFVKAVKVLFESSKLLKEIHSLKETDEENNKALNAALKAYSSYTNNSTYLTVLSKLDNITLQQIKPYAEILRQGYQNALKEIAEPVKIVRIFADGNVKAVAEKQESNSGVGNGSLGIQFTRGLQDWGASINIAASNDQQTSGFGASVLAPGTGKALRSGYLDFRYSGNSLWNSMHSYMTFSGYEWSKEMESEALKQENTSVTKNATVIGVGCLWFANIVKGEFKEGENSTRKVGLSLEAGLALRWLSGDVTNDKMFLKDLIGSKATFYPGLEFGLQISYGKITAGLNYYYIDNINEDKDVLGLTGSQLVVGIGLSADIREGIISSKKKAK